ncbi:MAG TPA: glycoside hydrolase domain-containing protein, partial [Longimicrobiaceae bacterium]|nr:glycoside hydrolase domain-containing protein [Longimicrobiaceae bacterium]
DAIARAAAEGFPAGTTIFLDVEPVRTVPDSLLAYYRAWTETLLRDGRYLPGTYVHQANAVALYDVARDAYQAAGRGEQPPFWVAGGRDFSLQQPPWAIGLPFVTLWQGVTDVDRTWGGMTLRVDENVATRADPSAPQSGAAADLAS